MRIVSESFFVLRKLTAKLMLDDKLSLQQQIEGIVYSSQTYPVIFLHYIIQYISIKMSIVRKDPLQNGISLRSFSMLMYPEVFSKYIFYFLV